jgi:hypothetical protein
MILGGALLAKAIKRRRAKKGQEKLNRSEDAAIKKAQQEQESAAQKAAEQAQGFRESIGGRMQRRGDLEAAQAGSDIRGGMQDVRRGASSRGLLYSGLSQAGQADVAAQAGGAAAQRLAGYAQNLDQTARGMEDQAVQQGMQAQSYSQDLLDELYNRQLQQHKSSRGFLGRFAPKLGKAIGGIMGGGMGG